MIIHAYARVYIHLSILIVASETSSSLIFPFLVDAKKQIARDGDPCIQWSSRYLVGMIINIGNRVPSQVWSIKNGAWCTCITVVSQVSTHGHLSIIISHEFGPYRHLPGTYIACVCIQKLLH